MGPPEQLQGDGDHTVDLEPSLQSLVQTMARGGRRASGGGSGHDDDLRFKHPRDSLATLAGLDADDNDDDEGLDASMGHGPEALDEDRTVELESDMQTLMHNVGDKPVAAPRRFGQRAAVERDETVQLDANLTSLYENAERDLDRADAMMVTQDDEDETRESSVLLGSGSKGDGRFSLQSRVSLASQVRQTSILSAS
jgi:hypothetical protein